MADDGPSRATPTRSNVAQYFGRLAQSYGDGEYYIRRRTAVVAAIADEVAGARRLLDLGCGNGRYLYEFRKSSLDAIAVGADLSFDMLAEARGRNGVATPLLRIDATAVPFRAGVLDVIFASHVFQFIADKDTTMRDLARCLAPGGAIILTISRSGIRQALRPFMSHEQWTRLADAAFPSRRALVAAEGEDPHRIAMERAGLAIETRDASFAVTWDGLVEWIFLRWGPFMDAEQRALASSALDDVAPQLSSHRFELVERLLIGRAASR